MLHFVLFTWLWVTSCMVVGKTVLANIFITLFSKVAHFCSPLFTIYFLIPTVCTNPSLRMFTDRKIPVFQTIYFTVVRPHTWNDIINLLLDQLMN